jgi:hypothetical protein
MRIRFSNVLLILFVLLLSGLALYASQVFIATPINDLGTGTYLGFQGGLYQNGTNLVPTDHNSDGKLYTDEITPLNAQGNPDSNGEVILLSMGMSNALIEFSTFEAQAAGSKLVNHDTLTVWDGAQSGQDACYWFPAEGSPVCSPSTQNEYDRIIDGLTSSGLSNLQVQALWVDNANGRVHPDNRGCQPQGTLCVPLCDPALRDCVNTDNKTNALNEEEEFGEALRAAKTRFPNLKLAFFSGRVFGGYAVGGEDDADPEPFAYESGFAVKWLIQAQINQISTGVVDPVAGDLSYEHAPWIAWGPYFWADGPNPRSDGLTWCFGQTTSPCNGEFDFSAGGLHLNPTGATKAANLMMGFFTTSPYTTPWFNAPKNPPAGGKQGSGH